METPMEAKPLCLALQGQRRECLPDKQGLTKQCQICTKSKGVQCDLIGSKFGKRLANYLTRGCGVSTTKFKQCHTEHLAAMGTWAVFAVDGKAGTFTIHWSLASAYVDQHSEFEWKADETAQRCLVDSWANKFARCGSSVNDGTHLRSRLKR